MASIRKTKSGRWQARVYKDGRYVSLGTFRTQKEAKVFASNAEEKIYYGHTLNDRERLFEDVAHEWLHEHKRRELKPSTFEQTEVIVRRHVLPYFGRKRIAMIRRPEIKRWMDDYMDKDYSFGSRLKYLSVLKSIFHYALHELEILEKNPSDKLRVPLQDKTEKNKIKYYSMEELNELLTFMEHYKHQRFSDYRLYYMLMIFLSHTGLRISEALALKWSDIEGDKLHVNKQIRRNNNNRPEVTTLKNRSSYRTIKLDQDLLDKLSSFKVTQKECFLKYKRFYRHPDQIIFQNYLGHYLTPSTVRDTIRSICIRNGFKYKGTHAFRHTHAVLLMEAGASLKFISERLGHKTIKTTADTYLDITDKIEEDELQKLTLYRKQSSNVAQSWHTPH